MDLHATLTDITRRLREGRFPNEQAISQGIVLRILQDLGWETWDTTTVWPEYNTGEGRADFALCHPPGKPAIFIEVKQPGKAEDSVKQALEYGFHSGVPSVVLTDGKTWSFYLPAEQGSYEDRRVYKLDLFEREPGTAAETLERYMSPIRVHSGAALESAREEYRNQNRRLQARAAIAESWNELILKGDELLVEMVADAVESKVGVRPGDDDVIAFLAGTVRTVVPPVRATPPPYRKRAAALQHPVATPAISERVEHLPVPSARHGIVRISGKEIRYTNAKDAMVIVLRELASTDASFLERCAHHPDAQGRKRRYIARMPEELYPDRPDLRDFREALPGDWYVATNLNNQLKKNIIRLACEVAGLTFGHDVKVEF